MTTARSVWTGNVPVGGSWWPGALLIVAAAVVGVAIVVDGTAARALNGVGAVLWLIAAAGLIRSPWGKRWRWTVGVVVLGWVVALAFLVRPRDLAAAVVGFMIAGAVVAAVARRQPLQWTLMVPALWLPVHLLLGIGRALLAEGGRLRTEPPPTAALVPLAMVVAAAAGGLVVTWWQRRQSSGRDRGVAEVAVPRA